MSESNQKKPLFSGPVSIPLSDESAAIQAAPAYDVEAAKRFISVMPKVRSLIDGIPKDDALTCFGACNPSPEAMEKLDIEIQTILADHHKVSLVMVDLSTQSGVAFHSTVPMCTQSTVKAIYVGALLTAHPQAFGENGQYIRDTVVLSSNKAYESLREIYGKAPIQAWCREAGVDEAFADPPYPRDKNARDMLKLWTRLYCFLNDSSDAANAGRYFADSAMSAAKDCFRGRFPVQTKAGWENGIGDDVEDYEHAVIPARFTDGDPLNDECATNDTGVVYGERGPYLFVIYSDYPCPYSTPNRLYGLTEALHGVYVSYPAP